MTTTTEHTDPIYCVKCRKKTESQNVEQVTMKNGRPATRADCQDCGTTGGIPLVAAQNQLNLQECSRCRIRKQNGRDLSAKGRL